MSLRLDICQYTQKLQLVQVLAVKIALNLHKFFYKVLYRALFSTHSRLVFCGM